MKIYKTGSGIYYGAAVIILLYVCIFPICAENKTSFRRILFEYSVPLAENAPAVAADGQRIAYADGTHIHIVKLPEGKKITSIDIPFNPQDRKGAQADVIGIIKDNVFVRLRYFDYKDRPDPDGSTALICGGQSGIYHIIKLNTIQKTSDIICRIPYTSWFAEKLYNNHLVFTVRNKLYLIPFEKGGKRCAFSLDSEAERRPKITGDRIAVVCRGHLCICMPETGHVDSIPYTNTFFVPFAENKDLAYAVLEDTVVFAHKEEIIACDFRGKLKWRISREDIYPVAGTRNELCGASCTLFCGISPDNGTITWRRPMGPVKGLSSSSRLFRSEIINGMFIVFQSGIFSVFDAKTGDVLLNFYQDRELKRRSYNTVTSVLYRMCNTDNCTVVGFETSVFGIDLTPTEEVDPGHWKNDIANISGQLSRILKSDISRKERILLMKKIGIDMMDTPQLAQKVKPLLRDSLQNPLDICEIRRDIVAAYYWVDEPAVLNAILDHVVHKGEDLFIETRFIRKRMVRLLTGYPDAQSVDRATAKIMNNPAEYDELCRKEAVLYRKQYGLDVVLPAEKKKKKTIIEKLYSGEIGEITEEFRKMLGRKNERDIERVLELLEIAPDKVVLALEKDINSISDLKLRKEGTALLKKAEKRERK